MLTDHILQENTFYKQENTFYQKVSKVLVPNARLSEGEQIDTLRCGGGFVVQDLQIYCAQCWQMHIITIGYTNT